jgi:putative membrane protein
MKKLFAFFFVGVCLAVASAPGNADDKSTVSSADKAFVTKAAQGGMMEVQLGQLAAGKGMSQDVKDFGSKMVTDHGRAGDELKGIATSKGLTLPDKLDDKHQAMVDKMGKLSGAAFDKEYVTTMVKAHKADDALFVKEASSGSDPDLKAFADKTDKDVVKMHLQMIEDIQSKMK